MKSIEKIPVFLVFLGVIATTAHGEDVVKGVLHSNGFPDSLVSSDEEGIRSVGICPFRKDSPAFHFEAAEQGETILTFGEFNSATIGGVSFLQKVPQAIPEGSHALIRGGYGSFNTAQTSATASFGTKQASVMGGYGYRRADVAHIGGGGLKSDVYPSTSPIRYRTDTRVGVAYESNSNYLRLNVIPYEPLAVSLSWLRIDARNVLYPMLKLDKDFDTSDLPEATARLKKPFTGVSEIVVGGYWRNQELQMNDRLRESARLPNGALRPFSMQSEGEVSRYGARISAAIPLAGAEAVLGGDYGMMNVDAGHRTNNGTFITDSSNFPDLPDVTIETKGLYLTYGTDPASKIQFTAGLREDFVSAGAGKAPSVARSEHAVPSGWLKGRWRSDDSLDVSFAFGSTMKFPNAQELYIGVITQSSQIGNPELTPARTYRPEISVDFGRDPLSLRGYAFWSRIEDYVTIYQLNQTTKSYRNVEAEIWGAGISAALKLPADLKLKLVLDYSRGDDLSWSRPLPEFAPLTGNATIGYDDSHLFANVTERFSSRQWRVDSTMGENPNASWAVTDIKAGYRFKGMTLSAGVDNLADSRYCTNLLFLRDPLATGVKVPEAGRFVWGMLEIAL